jgi:hypothetical protein
MLLTVISLHYYQCDLYATVIFYNNHLAPMLKVMFLNNMSYFGHIL